jgi:t-SNARE complex subunit (syntaxin)
MASIDERALDKCKEQLERDILLLKQTMEDLHDIIQEQGASLNTIEDEIVASKEEVQTGTEIVQETSYMSYMIGCVTAFAGTVLVVAMLL